MAEFPKKLQLKLDHRRAQNAFRSLPEGLNLVDFSSNDYLGFSRQKAIQERAHELMNNQLGGSGATGSRLLTGNHGLYHRLESVLAEFYDAESALVFNSGYDANLGFFASVPQRTDLIVYDAFCHASIRDGIRLSEAKSLKFNHNDLAHLKQLVERGKNQTEEQEVYVVTESVFSMDGDSPDLLALVDLCAELGLRLVVDEAHAVGVFGKGLLQVNHLQHRVFARIVTFGKAMGAHGAAVLGSERLKSFLINFARSLIYTTALSPHTVATVLGAHEFFTSMEGQGLQQNLRTYITLFLAQMEAERLTSVFLPSNSAIQVALVGGNSRTKQVSAAVKKAGFDVRPILAPTVPEGQERLRFCLHSYNTPEQMVQVLGLLKKEMNHEQRIL